MDMWHRYGHAASVWKWKFIEDIDIDIENDMGIDIDVDNDMSMNMNMDVNMDMDRDTGVGMDMAMDRAMDMGVDINMDMDRDMDMDMDMDMYIIKCLHERNILRGIMIMQRGHAAWRFNVDILHSACSIDLRRKCNRDIQPNAAWTCNMEMQHEQAAWRHRSAAWTNIVDKYPDI
jgi:hypothetical protein